MEKAKLKLNSDKADTGNHIIGIGASAGGLEAINELFDNMPSKTGFSFIIVQHLSPDHKSLMAELLAKHTAMPVFQAEDGIVPAPDCIYLIPSRKIITIVDGKLKLEDKSISPQPSNVIDRFFESLAADRQKKAIAIILSGTGTDGTKGIHAIKNEGGIVLIQDPISAQFDGMPNSAIASGYVDLILSPDMMPEELLDYIKEAPLVRSFTSLSHQEEGLLLDILQLVYKHANHDFANYKRPTIHRRLAKRMAERNIKSISDYYDYLGNHPEEIHQLVKELLLHVTQFFRDEEAFNVLEQSVIPQIINGKEPGEPIKVWTIACSTGEEVYSLAILFDECSQRVKSFDHEIKIFATDISQSVIEIASRGVFTRDQVRTVSPERLRKYFIKEGDSYRIIPILRKMVVFAKHDITRDPPFGRIDLLTCRNMLIYMNSTLQKAILQKLHFSVNDNGYFFLGASENIGVLKDAVAEIDRKWKIYKCISKVRIEQPDSYSSSLNKLISSGIPSTAKAKNAIHHLPEIFKDTLLDEYDIAGVMIDRDFEVKQATGSFRKFMDFPESTFNFNLLKLIPTDLSLAISTGVRKSIKDNERVVIRKVKVMRDNEQRSITVIIKPYLQQRIYLQPFLFIVLKEELMEERRQGPSVIAIQPHEFGRIEELELELRETKENLQALLEEVESANEELQSSNEEIISSNEELQSTNEELQSLNEELHTVNAEHQSKIKELIELNDDLNNYFTNTEIGQIFVDSKLRIRKFTPAATRQVNLKTGDIGRPIADFSTNMTGLDFVNEIKSCINQKTTIEKKVTSDNGGLYLMRVVPYIRQAGGPDGAVINFIDISDLTRLNSILEAVFESTTNGIIGMKSIRNGKNEICDFGFITSNRAADELLGFGYPLTGKKFTELYGNVNSELMDMYRKVAESGEMIEVEFLNPSTNRWFNISAVKMFDGLVVTFIDINDKKTASEQAKASYEVLQHTTDQLKASNHKLEQSNLDLLQFASVASHDLKEPLRKIQVFGNLMKDTAAPKLNDSETKYLDKVIKSTGRMQVLIEDILTLSRLSNSEIPLTPVDLNTIINEITEDLEVTIRETGARIIGSDLPVIFGIPGQIHQLFQNLVSNAIKFNEGQPVVKISRHDVGNDLEQEFNISGKNFVAIHVEDNGIGFDTVYTKKIFGVFQRLEKTRFPGTGIGLAIVKKIVDNHKGFIKAESEPGGGACFIILLPLPSVVNEIYQSNKKKDEEQPAIQ